MNRILKINDQSALILEEYTDSASFSYDTYKIFFNGLIEYRIWDHHKCKFSHFPINEKQINACYVVNKIDRSKISLIIPNYDDI